MSKNTIDQCNITQICTFRVQLNILGRCKHTDTSAMQSAVKITSCTELRTAIQEMFGKYIQPLEILRVIYIFIFTCIYIDLDQNLFQTMYN